MNARIAGKLQQACVEFEDISSVVIYGKQGLPVLLAACLPGGNIHVSTCDELEFGAKLAALGYGKRQTKPGDLDRAIQE